MISRRRLGWLEDEPRVVIAVDPHEASWTAAVVSSVLAPPATITGQVGPQGYRRLRRFAYRRSTAVWDRHDGVQRGRLNPYRRLFGQVTPRARHRRAHRS